MKKNKPRHFQNEQSRNKRPYSPFNIPSKYEILILAAITVILLIPFANKAFHIDDPLFIWAAKNIQAHPGNPYGFNVNWYNNSMGMWEITKNPPLACYYIAFVARLIGWGETGLHLAFILPAIAVILGTYLLSAKLCSKPLLAGFIALSMPVFLISSTTVMCDTMMLALWVWATVLWMRGIEKHDHISLAAASLFVALAALTKYFGVALLLLLPVYAIIKRRGVGSWAIYMLIPAAILYWYQLKTQAIYGRGLLLDATVFATEFRSQYGPGLIIKSLVSLAFTGGCLASVLFYVPFLWSKKALLIQSIVLILAILAVFLMPGIGKFPLRDSYGIRWPYIIQFCTAVFLGLNALLLTVFTLWKQKTEAGAVMLLCWIFGTIFFAGIMNWSVNGRSILPMVPAMAIIIAKRIDQIGIPSNRKLHIFWPLLPAFCLALVATQGDYILANTTRRAAKEITYKYGRKPGALWFQGHWGFQYYMELNGAKVIDRKKPELTSGDTLVVPENNCFTFPLSNRTNEKMLEIMEFPLKTISTTMSRTVGAGFYLDLWGPLPYVLSLRIPPERYSISAIE